MNDGDRRARIKGLVIDSLGIDADAPDITDDANLIEDLAMDSASLLRLVTALESAFGITVEDDELRHDVFRDIRSLDEFVQRKQAG